MYRRYNYYEYDRCSLPCLHCHPRTYIRMVQHLIEKCLLIRMSRDECINALAHHANIMPQITLTVWRELLKENDGFFQQYLHPYSHPSLFKRFAAVRQYNIPARRRHWR